MQRLSSYSSRLLMHANSSSTRHEPRLNKACEVSSSWGAFTLKRTTATKTANGAFTRTPKEGKAHVAASLAAQQAAERASSNAAASTPDASASEPILTRKQSQEAVADKLIDLFATKSPAEWRKLIAFSKQWASLADSVFKRLEERQKSAKDSADKTALRKLNRRLRAVHDELADYELLLQGFRERSSHEWESFVAMHRPSFTSDFFAHLENLVMAAHADPEQQEELAAIATKALALVTACDETTANEEAMIGAAQHFDDLLQVSSLEEADSKIDGLASSGQLNPALLLTMAKAYSAAKDTDMTGEQVKEIMGHLYFKAKESFAKMQPPEVRILKHLISIDSPAQRAEEMRNAFTPGPELETEQQDFLHTTPLQLLSTVEVILAAYERSAGSASMLGQAGTLMNPEVIVRMRDIQEAIKKHL